ncbi:MAG: sugar transferase [Acidimicrobiales bacterium]
MRRIGPRRSAARSVKRLVDVVGAGTALVVLSPVIGAVAALVRLRLGRPVVFVQARPGLHGRLFDIYKFRTMADRRGADGLPLPDQQRLTALGRFLRSTSLDELPELLNVLRGDMSLVGPRPLLPEYLGRYSPDQMRRHEMRPGLTGWSQVQGRNSLEWPQRFALDVWYVDNWSLRLDIRILLASVRAVLSREGISAHGHASMPRFEGSDLAEEDQNKSP